MKKLSVVLTLAALLALTGCASLPDQLPETMKQACSLYQIVKPEVLRLRAYARDNWTAIPPDVQVTLTKLNGYLPELDRAGQLICAASGVAGSRIDTSNVQWDDVLSTVVKVAGTAAELKAKGVI
jgi:hypothetical protein